MRSAPLEVTVKISSEVESWTARTTNYNAHDEHEKLSVIIDKGQNIGHFWNIKRSPRTQL
jgi:hypothetical protein